MSAPAADAGIWNSIFTSGPGATISIISNKFKSLEDLDIWKIGHKIKKQRCGIFSLVLVYRNIFQLVKTKTGKKRQLELVKIFNGSIL